MKVKISVYPVEKGNLKCLASATLDEKFAITGIRLLEGKKGLFIAMPQRYDKNKNDYYDIAYPITAETRKTLTSLIVDEYARKQKENEQKERDKEVSEDEI